MDVHSLEIGNKQVTQPLITIQLNRSANTASPNRDVSSMLNCIRVISVSNIHLINQLIALKKKIFYYVYMYYFKNNITCLNSPHGAPISRQYSSAILEGILS